MVSAGAPPPRTQFEGPSPAAPTAGAGFEGIGTGLAGSTVNSAPPDPNLDVGLNHIVQVVNTQIAVFSKTGALVMAPKNTNTLWAGFGGGCQTNNDGDAVVKYDRAAQRWIVSQFSVSTTPYLQLPSDVDGATPAVFQQSTYAPDTSYYRWMGSIGMDASGNMALGYSRSSSTAYPAIAYTGRLASDPANTLQAETSSGGAVGKALDAVNAAMTFVGKALPVMEIVVVAKDIFRSFEKPGGLP
jgi:hypothetical protein